MSPTLAQKAAHRVVHDAGFGSMFTGSRRGRPLPETPFSPMHRERAAQKRERRRTRRLHVDRFGYVQ